MIPSASRWLFVAATMASGGCSSSNEVCGSVPIVSAPPPGSFPEGVNVSGHGSDDCQVVFSSGTNVARYVLLPWVPPAYSPSTSMYPQPSPTHVPDAKACPVGAYPGVASCETKDGPSPTRCVRDGDCLMVTFELADAQAMLGFLGTATYDVSVQCGADQVLHATSVQGSIHQCAL